MECWHKANEESDSECRPMTQRKEQQRHTIAAVRADVGPLLLGVLAKLKSEATRGKLCRSQFKMVKIFVKQRFPGAEELLLKCLRDGLKKTKPFADIVKETPRQEGEACGAWVRRIWNQCDTYDTNCPTVITEELLQKLSRGRANKSEK
jgi:hypothetical protein